MDFYFLFPLILITIFSTSHAQTAVSKVICDEGNKTEICTLRNTPLPSTYLTKEHYVLKTHTRIVNSTYTDVFINLFRYFENLQSLDISHNVFQNILSITFEYAYKLEIINFSHNKFTRITARQFQNAAYLKSIDLSFNRIDQIDSNAFSGLYYLHTIDLSNNQLKTLVSLLFDIRIIGKVDLSNNLLTEVRNSSFNKVISNLNISNNQIKLINNIGENNNRQWTSIDISNNPIRNANDLQFTGRIRRQSHMNITHVVIDDLVKKLDVSYNKISSVSVATKPVIVELDLSHNYLTNTVNLNALVELEILDLSYNPLGDLQINSFANLNRLLVLNLQNTGLKVLTPETFSHQFDLKILNIANDQLEKIDFNVFVSLNNLKDLHLNTDNLLDTANNGDQLRGIFPSLKRLIVDASGQGKVNCVKLLLVIRLLNENNVKVLVNEIGTNKNVTSVRGINCQYEVDCKKIDIIRQLWAIGENIKEIQKKSDIRTYQDGPYLN